MKKENPDVVKTTKAQRHRKFAKFKDKMHSNFGSPTFNGMGEKKPIICSICHQHVHIARYLWIENIHFCLCDECIVTEAKLRATMREALNEKKKKKVL